MTERKLLTMADVPKTTVADVPKKVVGNSRK
jgi:hypothetical protein